MIKLRRIGLIALLCTIIIFSFVFFACNDNSNNNTNQGTEQGNNQNNNQNSNQNNNNQNQEQSDFNFTLLDDDTYAIKGNNKELSGELIIPSAYSGKTVTKIEANAFIDYKNLTSIIVPDSVVSIGREAFRGCDSLTSITLPLIKNTNLAYSFSNVEIPNSYGVLTGSNGFSYIPLNLKTIIITSGEIINAQAFDGFKSITSITIPDSVKSIGDYAFRGCSGLTSIALPNNLISLGNSAFNSCTNLSEIEIPNTATNLGNEIFKNCEKLTKITLGSGLSEIGNNLFENCSALAQINVSTDNNSFSSKDGILYNKNQTDFVYIPQAISGDIELPIGISKISASTFKDCTKITSISIPGTVHTIGYRAFWNCSSIKQVVISEGVTLIDSLAFEACTSLESIELPISVNEFGNSAFSGCRLLKTVKYAGTSEQWKKVKNKNSAFPSSPIVTCLGDNT